MLVCREVERNARIPVYDAFAQYLGGEDGVTSAGGMCPTRNGHDGAAYAARNGLAVKAKALTDAVGHYGCAASKSQCLRQMLRRRGKNKFQEDTPI